VKYLNLSEYLGLGSIIATVLVGIISWILSAYLTKKTLKRKKINYEIKMFPIISKDFFSKSSDLKIYFKDELLPEPTLLAVDIINSGNVAIENPPIEIEALGATYIIPGYIEDIPPGYEKIWELERTDAESCAIHLEHINPGQVVKARFFLDELPKFPPVFKSPMKDLEIREVDTEIKKVFLESLISALELTGMGRSIHSITKILKQRK
jgi:hypothetical protein